jgi:hypothetical protein
LKLCGQRGIGDSALCLSDGLFFGSVENFFGVVQRYECGLDEALIRASTGFHHCLLGSF